MKSILYFVAGFIACLLLEAGVSVYATIGAPFGSITYHGEGAVTATDGAYKNYEIDQKGLALPYGKYAVKLKNGSTISILKNNRGIVDIQEESNMVLVFGDANTVWVTLEKK